MSILSLAGRGAGFFTFRRMLLTSAAAAGLYTVGNDGLSYLKTANRLVSSSVADQIPVEFELERAKTMIGELKPDIKHNVIVIAHEEVRVDNIREEIDSARAALTNQRHSIVELRQALQDGSSEVRIGKRLATADEIEIELKRRFANYKLAETTLESKLDLLANRETSLEAARDKLKRMLDARRDLETQIENLDARLRTVQSEAVTSKVDFDESHVVRCEELIDTLRMRLQVAERLMSQDEVAAVSQPTKFNIGEENVIAEIDSYFTKSPTTDNSVSKVN